MSGRNSQNVQFAADFLRFVRLMVYLGLITVLVMALFMIMAVFRISSYTFATYDSIEKIPYNEVGLLLGTAATISPGRDNSYFTYRIMAATELYNAGKIKYILVSGDNRSESYNEPRMMYQALIRAGIPADRVIMDFAGIRTLDSVVRAGQVFLLRSMTVISQSFQNERALFIADHYGIRAVGFNASTPEGGLSLRLQIRELFARIKCAMDVYFLDTGPRHLGDPVAIGSVAQPKHPSAKPAKRSSKPPRPGPPATRRVRGPAEALPLLPPPDEAGMSGDPWTIPEFPGTFPDALPGDLPGADPGVTPGAISEPAPETAHQASGADEGLTGSAEAQNAADTAAPVAAPVAPAAENTPAVTPAQQNQAAPGAAPQTQAAAPAQPQQAQQAEPETPQPRRIRRRQPQPPEPGRRLYGDPWE